MRPAIAGVDLFIVSGINTVLTKDAVIKHTFRPNEHVSGDRAVNHGLVRLIGGLTLLGATGYRLLRTPPENPIEATPEAPPVDQKDDPDNAASQPHFE